MTALRIVLLGIFAIVLAYTGVVGAAHGLDFMPVFFGDIAARGWPGQFNLDFLGFLTLSALWVAWRHRFSASGLALGVVAFLGGSLFLSAYLLIASWRSDGRIATLLLGAQRPGLSE